MTDTDQQVVPLYQVGSKAYMARGVNSLIGEMVVVHEVIVGRAISYRVRSWPSGNVDALVYEESLTTEPFATVEVKFKAEAKVRLRLTDTEYRALLALPEDDRQEYVNDTLDGSGYDEWSFEISEELYDGCEPTDEAQLKMPRVVDPNQTELAL